MYIIHNNFFDTNANFVTNNEEYGYSTRTNQHFYKLPTIVDVSTRNITHHKIILIYRLQGIFLKTV